MASRAVLFDLDGTVWDSYTSYAAGFIDGSGITPTVAERRLRTGENIVRLIRESSLSQARYCANCRSVGLAPLLYPGFPEIFDELIDRGYSLGIVTNLPKWLVEPSLDALDILQYFRAIQYAARKPSPSGVIAAMKALGITERRSSWLAGDRETDFRAARSAGLRFAWASYGYGTNDNPQADVILGTAGDILCL